jgi:hypothetical protein
VMTKGEKGVWGVFHIDLPGVIAAGGMDDVIDSYRDAYLSNQEARLLGEKSITLDNHPGRAWHVDSAISGRGFVKAYLVGNRFFMVAAFGDEQFLKSEETGRFFSSFQLVTK